MRLYSMNKNFLKGFCVPLLATSLLTGCAERDTEPPKIEVAKEDLHQEMYFGFNLNLIDWYNYDGRVKVTDNVDKDIKFRITADEDYYDEETGEVDTSKPGTFKGKIIAEDKAGNTSSKTFTVKLIKDFDNMYCAHIKYEDVKDACYSYQDGYDEDDLPSLDELRDNLYKVQDEINAVNEAKSHSNN